MIAIVAALASPGAAPPFRLEAAGYGSGDRTLTDRPNLLRIMVGEPLPADGGDADALLGRFTEAGVDLADVAARLQRDGAVSFVTAWNELMTRIEAQTSAVA